MKSDWKKEIIKKLPWSATFLVASFSFFKFTNYEIVGWICLIVAIIALFLVIKFEYYEKIINRQEQQIDMYSKRALETHKDASETLQDANTSMASSLKGYKKDKNSQTSAE